MSAPLLEVDGLGKTFASGDGPLHVLEDVSFQVAAGETLALTGPSGSGKSTLLGLLAALDRPSRGAVRFEGETVSALDEDRAAAWRRHAVGFIFQNFRLVQSLTALENVALPLEILGRPRAAAEAHARGLLAGLGLSGREGHFPAQLSGGEQQRCAIARAYAHEPRIIFADEPTGSLDRDTADKVLGALLDTNAGHGTALVVVTHDPAVAGRMDRRLVLERGRIRA